MHLELVMGLEWCVLRHKLFHFHKTRTMKFLMLLCFCFGIFIDLQAQNNPIFNGGRADGVDRAAFLQADNNIFIGGSADGSGSASFAQSFTNIFNGGAGDGWSSNNFTQVGNNIFNGGVGDGWSSNNFTQAGNNIYNGGVGDGWSSNNFTQAGNNIYNGGVGDGWSINNFLQAGNNIFNGGAGDGWASVYRPLGPLPITILSFTAEKQNTQSLLQWEIAAAINFSRFEVERSLNAVSFFKIGAVPGTNVTRYDFKDMLPAQGANYYRLKLLDIDGSFKYTPVRVVHFGTKEQSLQVFPNPVTTFTNVNLTAEMQKENLVLNVINTAGQVVLHQRIYANSSSVLRLNMERLPAATYIIYIKGTTVNSTCTIIKQ